MSLHAAASADDLVPVRNRVPVSENAPGHLGSTLYQVTCKTRPRMEVCYSSALSAKLLLKCQKLTVMLYEAINIKQDIKHHLKTFKTKLVVNSSKLLITLSLH